EADDQRSKEPKSEPGQEDLEKSGLRYDQIKDQPRDINEQPRKPNTDANGQPAEKGACEPDLPAGNPGRDLPPAQLADRAVRLGTHLVGEPAQPVCGVAVLARVGIGGDEDLIKQMNPQVMLIGRCAR